MWFLVGLGGGALVGLVVLAVVLAVVRFGGDSEERPDLQAVAGENYCYRVAQAVDLDYASDDLVSDLGLDYSGTCTLTADGAIAGVMGESYEVSLDTLHPLLDWASDCHDEQRAGGVVLLPRGNDDLTCVSATSGIGWAGRMLDDSMMLTVDPSGSNRADLDERLLEILDAAEKELS